MVTVGSDTNCTLCSESSQHSSRAILCLLPMYPVLLGITVYCLLSYKLSVYMHLCVWVLIFMSVTFLLLQVTVGVCAYVHCVCVYVYVSLY